MTGREQLRLAHDLMETALLAGILLVLVYAVLRDGEHPLDVLRRHAGVA